MRAGWSLVCRLDLGSVVEGWRFGFVNYMAAPLARGYGVSCLWLLKAKGERKKQAVDRWLKWSGLGWQWK